MLCTVLHRADPLITRLLKKNVIKAEKLSKTAGYWLLYCPKGINYSVSSARREVDHQQTVPPASARTAGGSESEVKELASEPAED